MRYRLFILPWLIAAVLLSACGGRSATPTPAPVPTPDEAARQLRTFQSLWETVRDNLVYEDHGGVDWEAAGEAYRARVESGLTAEEFSAAMAEMVSELPEGLARYESRQARIQADTTDTSNYQGIGAFVTFREAPEPHVVLLMVMEGSPAETAGLKDHDSVYAVDGEPVGLDEGLGVVNRIRGPADTEVTLTIQSPGGSRRDVTVRRGAITTAVQPRAGRFAGTGIAYLRVPPVPGGGDALAQAFVQALSTWAESGSLSGLVIDLRIAGSGNGWPLGELLAMFGNGEIGEFYARTQTQPQRVAGQDVHGSQTVPLVILVGPDTQGVPEIFAGALQSMGRATLVGLHTPGEVELPTEFPLPDGSRVFVATTSFRTIDGRDLGLEGVTPDVLVDADWDQTSDENDPVLAVAILQLTK